MNVEQENRFLAILRSVQRRRRWSGTSRVMARAKSALMTRASAFDGLPDRDRTPTARRPSEEDLLDLVVQRDGHAHLPGDLGHRLGDGRSSRRSGERRRTRTRGTRGSRTGSGTGTATSPGISTGTSSPAGSAGRGSSAAARRRARASGRSVGSTLTRCGESRSRHLRNGDSRTGRKRSIFTRLSSRKRRNCAASCGERAAISCSIRPTSGVALSSPPPPKTR